MKPQGRKYFKNPGGSKHHVKTEGKIHTWWEDICEPNKTLDKTRAKKHINHEINNLET